MLAMVSKWSSALYSMCKADMAHDAMRLSHVVRAAHLVIRQSILGHTLAHAERDSP